MKKLFYYEGNYLRNFGNDVHYAILTIEEGDFSIIKYKKEYGNCNEIDFSEKESGRFKVEYGSNMRGTEEVVFAETLEEAQKEYHRMEKYYCEDMSKLSKPLEELIINKEKINLPLTSTQQALLPYIKNGTLKVINIEQ